MPKKLSLSALCFVACAILHAQTKPAGLGRPASAEELKERDITVLSTGAGLPDGNGTAAQGEAVYRDKCAACHGPNGEGNMPQGPPLVGGRYLRRHCIFAESEQDHRSK